MCLFRCISVVIVIVVSCCCFCGADKGINSGVNCHSCNHDSGSHPEHDETQKSVGLLHDKTEEDFWVVISRLTGTNTNHGPHDEIHLENFATTHAHIQV